MGEALLWAEVETPVMDVQAHHARIVAKRLKLAGCDRAGQARDGFIRDPRWSFGAGRKIEGSARFVKYLETYWMKKSGLKVRARPDYCLAGPDS